MPAPIRMLIVEDSPDDADLIVLELSRTGLAPVWRRVESGAEMEVALGQESWDLILSDYSIPGFGAEQALAISRAADPDLPFIVISGTIGEEMAVGILRAGASDYMLKGSLSRLAPAIDRELREAESRRARRRAEQDAYRLAALVESSSDVIISMTLNDRITSWNAAAERTFGWTASEAVGQLITILIPPDKRNEFESVQDRLRRREPCPPFETVGIRKGGAAVDVSINVSPVWDGDGRLIGAAAIINDITERKKAEAAVREARAAAERGLAQLRAVISSMTEGVIIADSEGNLLDWNESALRLHGYASLEEARKPLRDFADVYELTTPDGQVLPVSEWPMARILRGERLNSHELHVCRKDNGARMVISYSGAPVLGSDNGVRLVVLTTHDVTEHRRLEAERDRLLDQLRLQIERMPLGYVLLDPEDRVIDWNPAAERMFGYSKGEAVGMGPPFEKILPIEGWPHCQDLLHRLHGGDMAAHSTHENWTKDGQIIICNWFNTPLLAGNGDFLGVLSLTQDVTESRRLEEQLHQSQKMEAIGQLAGGVAHDFNNLLCIINGYSDLMLQGLTPDHPNHALLKEIRNAGERSASLTRQLLAFSRKQVVSPKPLDLNAVVVDTEKILRRLIGEDVELTTSLGGELGIVRADAGQMEQVLLNLAVNARDAMPQGGRLTIATRNVDLEEDFGRTRVGIPSGAYVLLAVTDTGCGMTAEVKAHIFEPFFTTKERGKGTGLGLAVVHGAVKQTGGFIEVESEPGVGTTFFIYLPRLDQSVRAAKSLSGIKMLPRGSETVLLVEDEDGVRALTRHMLQDIGYEVLEAEDGEEGLRVVSEYSGPIHLLITDVVMPGMNGSQVARELEALHPETKVLFVSGYTDDAVLRNGIAQEKVHFLPKPFSPIALACKIREVLGAPGLENA